jgi:GNAT superfamily N-acetyltransferase
MMNEVFSFHRLAELIDDERAAIRALTNIVYPPAQWVGWPGYEMEWTPHGWCIRIRGSDGGLLCYVGLVVRQARHEGRPVLVGGVTGVKTHPDVRGRGLARLALRRADEFFREQGAAFALLVCEPHLIGYYERLGWQAFSGRLIVTQRGVPGEFTFLRVMVCGIVEPAPLAGVIDLAGPPW